MSALDAVPADATVAEVGGLNREEWLTHAVDELRPIFNGAGYKIPNLVHVSVGWPSSGGLGTRKQTIGQAWPADSSEDKSAHVFISPVLGKSIDALDVLVHELGHVVVGNKCGHRGPFVRWMKALGMVDKPTQAKIGDELRSKCELIIERIGEYPHSRIAPPPRKIQGTRMLKVFCPECGYTLRTTRRWLDEGVPTCPCGTLMVDVDTLDEETDDPLAQTSATHEYLAHGERFEVKYLKKIKKGGIVERRWLVLDWEHEGRMTALAARDDVIGFMLAVLEGVYVYDDSNIIDTPYSVAEIAEVDWDDDEQRDYLLPGELEAPDAPEDAELDGDDQYPALDEDEPVEVLP